MSSQRIEMLEEKVEMLENRITTLIEYLEKFTNKKLCKKCGCRISKFCNKYCNDCADVCYSSDCGCDYHRFNSKK